MVPSLYFGDYFVTLSVAKALFELKNHLEDTFSCGTW